MVAAVEIADIETRNTEGNQKIPQRQ